MPTLIIMRHAKSVDRMEAEDDFERGLTARGHSDADDAAAAMKRAGLRAGLALVSPARRTRETWKHLVDVLGDPPVQDPMALYHATHDMLIRAVIAAINEGAEDIVLVGHNPGIGALVHGLADSCGEVGDLPYGWPTSAAAAFTVQTEDGLLTASKRLMVFDPKA